MKYLLSNGEVFDTTNLYPHVECYEIIENILYEEFISGHRRVIGEIVTIIEKEVD